MTKDSKDPPTKNESVEKTEPEAEKKGKTGFLRRGSKDKKQDTWPKQKWGKAITGVRAVSRVRCFYIYIDPVPFHGFDFNTEIESLQKSLSSRPLFKY